MSNQMPKEALLLFSKDVYPSGQSYRNNIPMLQQAQGDWPKVIYSYGVLRELIFAYDGTTLSVTEPRTNRDISQFDLVFFQKWLVAQQHALAAALYLKQKKIDFFSREVLHQNPISKLAEMVLLIQHGLPYPKTIVAPLPAYKQLFNQATAPLSYPIVLKAIEASRGGNNYLIRNEAELAKLIKRHALDDIAFMAQEYIPNDCDYRLTITGGKLQYVLQRTSAGGTHLNNTSQGGKGVFVPLDYLPPRVTQEALKAAQALGREDFAGVDIIVGNDGRHWVLEVNKSPEIQTGVNVEYKSKLLNDYITQRLWTKRPPEA